MNESPPTLVLREAPIPESLLPAAIPWVWIGAGMLFLILLIVTALILLNRRKPIDPTAARRAALAQALREIDEASSLAPRLAATQVSLALRRYLSTAAQDPSLYETHEEFLARHPSLSHWNEDTIHALVATLKQLAEIKYRPLDESIPAVDFLTESRSLLQSLDSQSAA